MGRVIRISDEVYKLLIEIQSVLQLKHKTKISMNDVIMYLIENIPEIIIEADKFRMIKSKIK